MPEINTHVLGFCHIGGKYALSHQCTNSSTIGPGLFSSAWRRLTIRVISKFSDESVVVPAATVIKKQNKGEVKGDRPEETLWMMTMALTCPGLPSLSGFYLSRIQPTILKSRQKFWTSLSIKMWGWIMLRPNDTSLLPSRCLRTR